MRLARTARPSCWARCLLTRLPWTRASPCRVRSKDVTLQVSADGYHDLHHDPETPRLTKRMAAWLKAHGA